MPLRLYMVLLQLRSDSVFGYETYSVFREAVANCAEDRITGDWEEVKTMAELKRFVQFDFTKIVAEMREVCPSCEARRTAPRQQHLQDSIAIDLDLVPVAVLRTDAHDALLQLLRDGGTQRSNADLIALQHHELARGLPQQPHLKAYLCAHAFAE